MLRSVRECIYPRRRIFTARNVNPPGIMRRLLAVLLGLVAVSYAITFLAAL